MQLIATCIDNRASHHPTIEVDEKHNPVCVWLRLAQPPQLQGNAGNTDQAASPNIAPLLRCF